MIIDAFDAVGDFISGLASIAPGRAPGSAADTLNGAPLDGGDPSRGVAVNLALAVVVSLMIHFFTAQYPAAPKIIPIAIPPPTPIPPSSSFSSTFVFSFAIFSTSFFGLNDIITGVFFG